MMLQTRLVSTPHSWYGPFDPCQRARPPAARWSAADAGMALFLLSLSVLFMASLVAYGLLRGRAASWPPVGTPALPAGLWLSTLLLVCTSASVHWSLRAARGGRPEILRTGLLLTLGLAVAFLFSQAANWLELVSAGMPMRISLYAWLFYLLTGLHAAHVIGGLVPLGVVTARAFRGNYSRQSHLGVRMCAQYWHFLDVVWLLLFGTVFLTG